MKEGKSRGRAEEGNRDRQGIEHRQPKCSVEGRSEPVECFSFSSVQAILDHVSSCRATKNVSSEFL